MRDWVRNLFSPRVGERVAGTPTSASGASSFFLWWNLPFGERLTEIAVTLEVASRPEIDRWSHSRFKQPFSSRGEGGATWGSSITRGSRIEAR